MNSIGDLLPSVADTIYLSLSDPRTLCSTDYTQEFVKLSVYSDWERYTRLSLVASVNLVPGFEKLSADLLF